MAKKNIGLSRGLNQFRDEIKELAILPELEAFIPPLNDEESKLLEDSIRKDGVREALDVWKNGEKSVIVDGHNRYRIAKKLKVSFKTKEQKFNSIEEVKEWMLRKQLGRRNLSDANRTYLIGLLYNNSKSEKGKYDRLEKSNQPEKPIQKIDTAKTIAKQHGTSERSVKNAGDFVSGIEKLVPELKKEVLSGKEKVSKAEIQKLGKTETISPVESTDEIRKIVKKESENRKVNQEKKKKPKENVVLVLPEPKAEPSPELVANYSDEIMQIIKVHMHEERTINAILNRVLEELTGKLELSGTDVQKLAKAGYTLLRTDEQPNIRIKKIDKNHSAWVTLEKDFKSKAARDRRFKDLLSDKMTIKA